MTFGEKLLELRKQNNFSQEELAEKLGVSRQAISRWESGETMPDSPNLLQISNLFGVSADYLLRDDYKNEVPAPEKEKCLAIIGESIGAASLAAASEDPAKIFVPQALGPVFLQEQDSVFADEDEIEILSGKAGAILADPMYQPVIPAGTVFHALPHEAFSGRCYREMIPVLTGKNRESGVQLC